MALSPEQEKRLEYLDSIFKERVEAEMDEYPFYDNEEEGMEREMKIFYNSFPGLTEEEARKLHLEWDLLTVMKK